MPFRSAPSRSTLLMLPVLMTVWLSSCGDSTDNACKDRTSCASPTIYTTHEVDLSSMKCEARDLIAVRNKDREEIVKLCRNDYDELTFNGSARIKDGSREYTIGYLKEDEVEGGYLFFVPKDKACDYACGSSGRCVEPFFSVAADTNYYPYGTVIYVPSVKGVILPDGRVHDGHFRVEDTGGDIRGMGRFDFYTGFYSYTTFENPFVPLGLSDRRTQLNYKVVSTPASGIRSQRECWANQAD